MFLILGFISDNLHREQTQILKRKGCVFSKNVKSECKISVAPFSSKQSVRKIFVRLFVQIFKDRNLVYFCTDCYELSQFVFFFHLLLQDTCIYEVCFMVSVAFFSEVKVAEHSFPVYRC